MPQVRGGEIHRAYMAEGQTSEQREICTDHSLLPDKVHLQRLLGALLNIEQSH